MRPLPFRIDAVPVGAHNLVGFAATGITRPLAFGRTENPGDLIARRLGRHRHEFQSDEMRSLGCEPHVLALVRAHDQELGQIRFCSPCSHVPNLF